MPWEALIIIIINSECVSAALVTQHPKCMRCALISSVTCPDVPYFPYITS